MQPKSKLLENLKELVKPQHAAVAVIDMQNDFCHRDGFFGKGTLDSEGLGQKPVDLSQFETMVPKLLYLLDFARSVGIKIYIVRTYMDDRYLSPMNRFRNRQIKRNKTLCPEGEWGSQQFEGFEPRPGDTIITKHVYSAFINTNFKDILNEANVETLVVTGCLTHVCCESTIRDGCMLGFYPVAPGDCMAAYAKLDHEKSLDDIEKFFGVVTTSQEIIDLWKNNS